MKKEVKISFAPITNEDVVWVGSAYGHLVEMGETINGEEFASRIRKVYDCEASNKNRLAADFAQYGVETIGRSKMRDGRERVTWFAVKDVMLRTNKCVYKKLTEGAK